MSVNNHYATSLLAFKGRDFNNGLLLILIWFLSGVANANNVTVTTSPWGASVTQEFDPNKKPGAKPDPNVPGDLPGPPVDSNNKPLIPASENARAVPVIKALGGFNFDGTAAGKITITSINLNVGGQTRIHLPNNATKTLIEHESGHDTLNKAEYDARAKSKMTDAVRSLIGTMYQGEGADTAAKIADAKTKAQAVINARLTRGSKTLASQMDTLGEKYDKLTNHGKSKTVGTDKGVKDTLAERNKAPSAGVDGKKPDTKKPLGATAPDPARVFFDETNEALLVGGDRLVAFTNDDNDPIINRGEILVDPLQLIGIQENGTIHLADSRMQIQDTLSGNLLLDAFLFELAYMPSSLPNFAGMVQGYLDIPPNFAGGINNTINSEFLNGLALARDNIEQNNGPRTTFWFFADQPLFNGAAMSLIGTEGVTGSLKIGVAINAPPVLLLLLLGFALLIPFLYQQRSVGITGGRPSTPST